MVLLLFSSRKLGNRDYLYKAFKRKDPIILLDLKCSSNRALTNISIQEFGFLIGWLYSLASYLLQLGKLNLNDRTNDNY